jgi:hypothetical protein
MVPKTGFRGVFAHFISIFVLYKFHIIYKYQKGGVKNDMFSVPINYTL